MSRGAASEPPKRSAEGGFGAAQPRYVVTRMSDVEPEHVAWLWPGRIPLGKITLIDGDPGLGKSTMTLDLAARVTTGRPMPTGEPGIGPADVVILSAEDGLADTIRPRLDAAGADCGRVHALTAVRDDGGLEGLPSLPANLPELEDLVRVNSAVMVVVDPLMAYLGSRVDAYRDHDVRRAMAPLSSLAERTSAAILIVRHLRKSRGGSAVLAGGGSIGIGGAARSVLVVARHPEDTGARVVAVAKSNLASEPAAIGYGIADAGGSGRIAWLGCIDGVNADALVALAEGKDEGRRGAVDDAVDWLRQLLADGPLPVKEVRRQAEAAEMAWRGSVERAKARIGVVSFKGRGQDAGWYWRLPDQDPQAPGVVDLADVADHSELLDSQACETTEAPQVPQCRSGEEAAELPEASDRGSEDRHDGSPPIVPIPTVHYAIEEDDL